VTFTAGQEKEKERQRLAEEAKKNQSFGARVRNIFDYHPTPPPAQEKHHLFSHTHTPPPEPKDWKDHLHFHTPPPEPKDWKDHLHFHTPPPEPKDWKDKLSELTGLGARPEPKEGMYLKQPGYL
jgi:hypothetical protein